MIIVRVRLTDYQVNPVEGQHPGPGFAYFNDIATAFNGKPSPDGPPDDEHLEYLFDGPDAAALAESFRSAVECFRMPPDELVGATGKSTTFQ